MPVETFDGLNNGNTRKNVTHLEAFNQLDSEALILREAFNSLIILS